MALLSQAAAVIVGLAATATALGVLSRLRPVRWLWRQLVASPVSGWFRQEVTEVVEPMIEPLQTRLDGIDAELHPNGGHSLADKVDRIEATVTG